MKLMKAVVYSKYGPPGVLELREVEKPVPTDNQVLIKVQAASVNLSDWECLRGTPLYARISGLLKPSKNILGSDVAGIVETVGSRVERFKPGDAVFGDIMSVMGGFAEYACAPEKSLALKPAGLTFEEAAAFPQAAVIAVQGIRDKAQIQPGMKVLINGAGGGTGTFAVQLAKLYGAEVTGVDNSRKLDMLRKLGADHVIDYTKEDFTKNGQSYDFILDLVAHRSVFAYKRALNSNGDYYMVGGSMPTMFQVLLLGTRIGKAERKNIRLLMVRPNTDDLLFMTGLHEDRKINVVIDRNFSLSEVPEALQYLGEGQARGKIVITMDRNT
jgi:NADPH:quinone reductase-like Zn-dependent oxidoreductase